MTPIVEAPELILEREAHGIAKDWRNKCNRLIACECLVFGVRVKLSVEPGGIPLVAVPAVDAPTECERDIIDAIRAAGRRLTQPQVIDAIAKAGKFHGDSTVVTALARMVKYGRLSNVKRRGYAIADDAHV